MNDQLEFAAHPQCSGCKTAYVIRRALSLSKGWTWAWMPDCRLKSCSRKSGPEVVDEAGEVLPSVTA